MRHPGRGRLHRHCDNTLEEIAEFAYAFQQILGPVEPLSVREISQMKGRAA